MPIAILKPWSIYFPLFFLFLGWPFLMQTDEFLNGITAQMVFYVMLCGACIGIFMRQGSFRIKVTDLLLGVFAAWYGFRILASDLPVDRWTILTGCAGLLLYFGVRNTKEYRLFFCFMFLGGLIQSCWYLMQRGGLLTSYNPNFEGTGSFNNPAILSVSLALSLLAGLYLMRSISSRTFQWPTGGALLVMTVCILLLSSRACWIGLFTGGAWLVWMKYRKSFSDMLHSWSQKKRIAISAGGIMVISGALAILIYGLYALRPESADGRLMIWQIATDLWQEAPWVGNYSFQSHYMPAQAGWFVRYPDSSGLLTADNVRFAFNEPLRIACETGVIGLGLFLLLTGYLFVKTSWKSREVRYAGAMLVILFTFGLFGYPFSIEWLVLITLCLTALLVNETDEPSFLISELKKLKYIAITCAVSIGICSGLEFYLEKQADLFLESVQHKPELLLSGPGKRYVRYLAGNPDFMLCYARTLYNHGYYPEALSVMEQAFYLRPSSHLVCDQGICLEETGAYEEAEAAYLLSARMVPGHILPRYRLFELYRKKRQWDKAAVIAHELLEKPVKIVNTTVLKARHQARKFLQEQSGGITP